MPAVDTLVFDLDGTLVDSAPGILEAFRIALAGHGLEPREPLVAALIGPPLAETLRRLSGRAEDAELAPLITAFKSAYDHDGVLATPAYPGIAELLAGLAAAGHELHVATNKRLAPALAILERLGLRSHFASVHALDMVEPRLPDKAVLIGKLLADRGLSRERVAYIGDKAEDGVAATANGLAFHAVAWGYGEFDGGELPPGWRLASSPGELLATLTGTRP